MRPPAPLRQSAPLRLVAFLDLADKVPDLDLGLFPSSADDDGLPVDVKVIDGPVGRHVEGEARHVVAVPQVLVDVGRLGEVRLQVDGAAELRRRPLVRVWRRSRVGRRRPLVVVVDVVVDGLVVRGGAGGPAVGLVVLVHDGPRAAVVEDGDGADRVQQVVVVVERGGCTRLVQEDFRATEKKQLIIGSVLSFPFKHEIICISGVKSDWTTL